MLQHKQNPSTNDVSGVNFTQSNLISEEHQAISIEIEKSRISIDGSDKTLQSKSLNFASDSSKFGISDDGEIEAKGKLIVSEDRGDHSPEENRFVERDFMQLSGNSSKREVEDDDDDVHSGRGKKPKVETLDLSLAFPDVSLSLVASNRIQPQNGDVSLNPSRSLQSLGRSNSNNTQTSFSTDFSDASFQFSHNPSCSMTRNSTENYEIWNAGEGTNGSVHSRFRPIGDNNLSFFPSELVAKPGMKEQSGERILQEIVSESISIMAQVIQELTDETVRSTKDYLRKLIMIPERRDDLVRLQLRLERRSDLTTENLTKANRNQIEILVSIRTGVQSFLALDTTTPTPTNELVEIFCYKRCKNMNCKRALPVDDCKCKLCSIKGFCSECMCPVCLNFDCANNTCSWVGCDVCSHWCHAACGLEKNLIRPGLSLTRPVGTTEVQFHCGGCGHASEMFGFIKDVFKTCVEEWSSETLMKELKCVKRIFRGSLDFKGKELFLKVSEMITKLDNKTMSVSDACSFILQFFDCKSDIHFSQNEWSVKSTEGVESVESLVRIKEVEARMFQNKADEARKEAEGYKRMMRVNIEKLDEVYTEKINKVCLREYEERKKQKLEEFKVLEGERHEYHKMKMRMQTEIAGLLQRMENTKKQWV